MTAPAESIVDRHPRSSIAPVWHTCILAAVFIAISVAGSRSQSPTSPGNPIPSYIGAIVFEWVMFAYVWWGIRLRKFPLANLIRRGSTGTVNIWRDVLAGFSFWIFWYGAETLVEFVLHAAAIHNRAGSGTVFPQGGLQAFLWVVMAASSGFCEEIAFRGYFLQQFSRWTRSASLGVLLQAILFGCGHTYLGARQVILIVVSGVLFGIFAEWFKNLRPLMVAHAWADIFGGLIFRGLPYK